MAVMTFASLLFGAVASAADPVDLSDKQGVVDPKDLKKDDPTPNAVKPAEPPPPEKAPDVPPFEVKKSHEGYPGNNPSNK
jgi:hypothetical protein